VRRFEVIRHPNGVATAVARGVEFEQDDRRPCAALDVGALAPVSYERAEHVLMAHPGARLVWLDGAEAGS
jgi:hypothetical protein